MSDSVALYLGNIPQFGDRQLLQGMTSEMNSKPICRRFCCGSVVGKVFYVIEWRGGGLKNYIWNLRSLVPGKEIKTY